MQLLVQINQEIKKKIRLRKKFNQKKKKQVEKHELQILCMLGMPNRNPEVWSIQQHQLGEKMRN